MNRSEMKFDNYSNFLEISSEKNNSKMSDKIDKATHKSVSDMINQLEQSFSNTLKDNVSSPSIATVNGIQSITQIKQNF